MGRGSTSLKARLSRHSRKQKRKHWHIDYLSSVQNAKVAGVVAAETEEKMECTTNRHLKETVEAKIPVRGFGASDCKDTCASHLLYFPRINEAPTLVKKVMKCYRDFNLSPMASPIPTPAFEASMRQASLETAKNSSD
jgi:Uri superfamily endonuclease